MEILEAVTALSALAQQTRLEIFRLLVREGPHGLPAGAIARRLMVPPATLSFHLKELEGAGLLARHRRGRTIIYAANYEGTRRVLAYLTEDCCQGRPEICGQPAFESVAACSGTRNGGR